MLDQGSKNLNWVRVALGFRGFEVHADWHGPVRVSSLVVGV